MSTLITSSPCLMARSPNFGDVNVPNATRLADEPEVELWQHRARIGTMPEQWRRILP